MNALSEVVVVVVVVVVIVVVVVVIVVVVVRFADFISRRSLLSSQPVTCASFTLLRKAMGYPVLHPARRTSDRRQQALMKTILTECGEHLNICTTL